MIKTPLKFRSSAGPTRGVESNPSTVEGGNPLAPKVRVRACDYGAPAALYIRNGTRLRYLGFARAALAVRYANEELTLPQLLSCTMEIDEDRFTGAEVQALYPGLAVS